MKRTLVIVTIIALMGPALGVICACCPMAQAAPVSGVVLTNPSCDCCPNRVQINEKRQATEQIGFSFQLLHRAFQTVIAAVLSTGALPDFNRSPEPRDSDPPPSSSIPLHLSLQVLRI